MSVVIHRISFIGLHTFVPVGQKLLLIRSFWIIEWFKGSSQVTQYNSPNSSVMCYTIITEYFAY